MTAEKACLLCPLFPSLEFSVLELQHIAVLLHRTLKTFIEPNRGVGLNLDGNPHPHARTQGKLLDHLIHQVGELLLGQDGIQINAAVELLLCGEARSTSPCGIASDRLIDTRCVTTTSSYGC